MTLPVALTIAGSDPSGGAGIQADLKTFHQHAVYGMSVITLLTVQNTQRVSRVQVLDRELVEQQLSACLEDIPPLAAKTGALGGIEVIRAVAERAEHFPFPLVVDPVMVSKHGAPLLDPAATRVLIEELLPRATLVTPNLPEAELLAGLSIRDPQGMRLAAERIAARGVPNVLVKGGHLTGQPLDLLWTSGEVEEFVSERIDTPNTHGTGCVYSAAITAQLARGATLREAVQRAKRFVTEAIRRAPGLGHGYGPVNLHVPT